MFVSKAAAVTVATRWKQPQSPQADECPRNGSLPHDEKPSSLQKGSDLPVLPGGLALNETSQTRARQCTSPHPEHRTVMSTGTDRKQGGDCQRRSAGEGCGELMFNGCKNNNQYLMGGACQWGKMESSGDGWLHMCMCFTAQNRTPSSGETARFTARLPYHHNK